MKERRGRPKKLETLIEEGTIVMQRQFTREFKNDDGTIDVWKYDLDKFPNGPISTEIVYPKNFEYINAKLDNSQLPLTQQKWINPANGKEVGYTRAKNLGLI